MPTATGPQAFAAGDRIQFTGNGGSRKGKEAGFVNGAVGTVIDIGLSEGKPHLTVELDGKAGQPGKRLSFTVGPGAGEFDKFRHGYAGTIYKGQGRTLDQTYVCHSEHWRAASSYVALTRHRESVAVFVSRDVAPDRGTLARQMGRDDQKRAASGFALDRGSYIRSGLAFEDAADKLAEHLGVVFSQKSGSSDQTSATKFSVYDVALARQEACIHEPDKDQYLGR